MKIIFILMFLFFVFIGYSSTKSYIIHKPISEVNNAIDSSMNKIGLEVTEVDSFKIIDGPLNRNSSIVLSDLNENTTKLRFKNPPFMGSLSDNFVNVFNIELSKNYDEKFILKSKLNHSILVMLNSGLGWYYMTENSIYWDENSKYSSLSLGIIDAFFLY